MSPEFEALNAQWAQINQRLERRVYEAERDLENFRAQESMRLSAYDSAHELTKKELERVHAQLQQLAKDFEKRLQEKIKAEKDKYISAHKSIKESDVYKLRNVKAQLEKCKAEYNKLKLQSYEMDDEP